MSVTEIVVPPHSAGPPLHTHDFDEAFYLLEGELIFQVEEALVTKGEGELFFVPRNVAHAPANHSDAPSRYLLNAPPRDSSATGRASPPRPPGSSRRGGRCSRSPRSPSLARRSRRRREPEWS